jgi:FkbM family methyltransferase
MNYIEKTAMKIRRLPFLSRLDYLWDSVRPSYDMFIGLLYSKKGLTRVINGTEVIRLYPECRYMPQTYEPRFWKRLMAEIRVGDIIADVGAFIGVYTVALARRVGNTGKVIAFEPDVKSCSLLRRHIALNNVSSNVEVVDVAIGDADGTLRFHAAETGAESESRVIPPDTFIAGKESVEVQSKTLDNFFDNKQVDIIKIDVEGYEEKVLRGAQNILKRKSGYPRAIFVEVHPYAWDEFGTESERLLSLLTSENYRIENADGTAVSSITQYGWIIAVK